MPYLTYEEYEKLTGKTIEPDKFEELLPGASGVLDSVTGYFYVKNELEIDVHFRKTQFKKALCAQLDYFHDVGGTSSHEINNPLTVSMGRTQVMTGADNQKKTNKLVSDEVYMYLYPTGLLYRGVR